MGAISGFLPNGSGPAPRATGPVPDQRRAGAQPVPAWNPESPEIALAQADNPALVIQPDVVRRRVSRQAGHGVDVPAQRHDKAGTGR